MNELWTVILHSWDARSLHSGRVHRGKTVKEKKIANLPKIIHPLNETAARAGLSMMQSEPIVTTNELQAVTFDKATPDLFNG